MQNPVRSILFLEPWHFRQFAEKSGQIWIWPVTHSKLAAKKVHGTRDADQKRSLVFDQSAETVSTEELQDPEQDEQTEVPLELIPVHGHILPCRVQISVNQSASQILGIGRTRLPHEGGEVVIYRSPASSLEIDKIRLAVTEHDITGLKVPI